MSINTNDKSLTFMIYPMTFLDLEKYVEKSGKNLGDIYIEAVSEYVAECSPDRLKVFAAPGAGKRIRVNLNRHLYFSLLEKLGNTGIDMKDAVYTAIECFLDSKLKKVAA